MPPTLSKRQAEHRDGLLKDQRLLFDMTIARKWAHRKSRRIERYIDFYWWGSLVLAGLASLGGFMADVPALDVGHHVEPWMISLLTAIAAGMQIIRQRASWRLKSNAYYRFRDVLSGILCRAEFDNKPMSDDRISELAGEFREAKVRLGQDLQAINTLRDDRDYGRTDESRSKVIKASDRASGFD